RRSCARRVRRNRPDELAAPGQGRRWLRSASLRRGVARSRAVSGQNRNAAARSVPRNQGSRSRTGAPAGLSTGSFQDALSRFILPSNYFFGLETAWRTAFKILG